MILYRIRHKETGKFLQHINYFRTGDTFTDYGCFWKKSNTVRKHLSTLASDMEVNTDFTNSQNFVARRRTIKVHPERYDLYEVVATHVTVNAEDTMSAADFMMPQGVK